MDFFGVSWGLSRAKIDQKSIPKSIKQMMKKSMRLGAPRGGVRRRTWLEFGGSWDPLIDNFQRFSKKVQNRTQNVEEIEEQSTERKGTATARRRAEARWRIMRIIENQ